jgi:hypothetical protein
VGVEQKLYNGDTLGRGSGCMTLIVRADFGSEEQGAPKLWGIDWLVAALPGDGSRFRRLEPHKWLWAAIGRLAGSGARNRPKAANWAL